MANTYTQFEKDVYDWFIEKHNHDASFTFSLRQKASKGAELDYFIGTAKSNYFGTTFWSIPVSYPGSSMDLIDLFFRTTEDSINYYFEFNQTKNPDSKQNEWALQLIRNIKSRLNADGSLSFESPTENKMETFRIASPKSEYKSIEELKTDLEEHLKVIIPIVDDEIQKMKASNKRFRAHRIQPDEFESFRKKLNERFIKYEGQAEMSSTNNEEFMNPTKYPLNQILFGPPGTGKTFHTINKSLEIILGNKIEGKSREELKTLYEEKVKEGQIVFTTFHQSMSYEDFIEGIKPMKQHPNDTFLKYEVQNGIFKEICEKAKSNIDNASEQNNTKLSFEDAFEMFKEAWEEEPDMKFPLKTKGYDFTITGFTNYSIQFRKASGGSSHTLSISTLKELYYGKEYNFKQGVGIYYPPVLSKLLSYTSANEITQLKKYVIIIDEINRGNVSQIFGELITLIETDKRYQNKEALEILLPYSKETFSVPNNLYIIGTMNTADRSVEALDTALRRRFSFSEFPPQPDLLENIVLKNFFNLFEEYWNLEWEDQVWQEYEDSFCKLIDGEVYRAIPNKIWGSKKYINANSKLQSEWELPECIQFFRDNQVKVLDVEKLLTTINSRIEKLLDKDHQIGHSFFFELEDSERPHETLIHIFENKIIPLLQEFFYADYGKIGLVLGNSFIEKKADEITFAKFSGMEDHISTELASRSVFVIKPSDNWDFWSIYE
jgi:5-methylcytosine-specific restriction protein B